jgi:SagB-type dehydrogenase family enzyme
VNGALYDLFWENTKLGPVTVQGFSRRIQQYVATEPDREALRYAGAPVPLGRPHDALARLMDGRRSELAFDERPLPARRLGTLFSAFGAAPDGSRTFPSAGATYPLEIFALLANVEGSFARTAVHYAPEDHSLTVVSALGPWEDYSGAVNLEGAVGIPHVIVVFVLFPERVTAKYGERGGRFALIEVGHAAQNLALRLTRARMAGCEIGGLWDERVKALLRLDGTPAQIALGYACGPRRRTPDDRRAAHTLRLVARGRRPGRADGAASR